MVIYNQNPIEDALKFGIHSDYSIHNVQGWYMPDGRIGVSLVCRSRNGYPDVRIFEVLNNESELYAWCRSLYYLLEAIDGGPFLVRG